jgi:flagellar protein FliT
MMDCADLKLYEDIAASTRRMVDAARSRDWDALVAAEEQCRALVERARSVQAVDLDEPSRRRKAMLIRDMLRDDAEVRAIAQPEMARLESLMRGRRLDRAYGSHASDALD